MNTTDHFLQVINLKKVYSTNLKTPYTVLQNISFKAALGEIIILMGPSGAGKSTLLNLLAGLEEPTEGLIKINSQNIFDLNDNMRTELRRSRFGLIFQFFELHNGLTCGETLELKFIIDKADSTEMSERVIRILEEVGLKKKIHTSINLLSRGEKQRVAIGRALVNNPQIILADEPTGALDFDTALEIMTLLRQIVKTHNSLLIISSHDYNIPQNGDRVLLIEDGKIIDDFPLVSREIFLKKIGIKELTF